MQSSLSTTKSIVARLLAGENLNVVHEKIPTAYFDLDNRTIHCPTWEDMDGALYDLLMAHEVSHGLHTPKEGWHHNVSSKGKGYKSVLNVVEDARIEKKIKRMYPGLSKSFAAAYKSLFDRDFFGIKRLKSLDKLNLADRINCYFKLGHLMYVPFTAEERVIVREIENADTWEQVVDLSDRVYAYMKDREQDKVQTVKDLNEDQVDDFKDDEDSESEDYEPSEPDDEDEDFDDMPMGDQFSDSTEEESDDISEGQQDAMSQLLDDPEDEDVKSVTDQIFRQREKELVLEEGDKVGNIELPEPILENIVMPFDIMISGWHKMMTDLDGVDAGYIAKGWNSSLLIERSHRVFRETNQNTINLLVKEFEMRKNASQYARAQTSRSGELDMTRLHNYKLTSDVFKRITVTPKGKNHGLILYVDMSGSMSRIFGATLEQVMILVQFCRRVNIPCDVYGFCDDTHGVTDQQAWLAAKAGRQWNLSSGVHMNERNFHLKPLISTSLTQAQFGAASDMLTVFAYHYYSFCSGGRYRDNDKFDFWAYDLKPSEYGFGLGGTPLTECIIASRDQILKFKSEKRLDVVNVIHLTDGAGGNCWSSGGDWWFTPKITYVTDRRTKRRCTVRQHEQQQSMTQFVRELTGCKQIGYYVLEGNMSKKYLRHQIGESAYGEFEKNYESFKKNGVFAAPMLGYDSYFYLRQNSSNLDDAEFKVEDNATKGKLKSAFIKHLRSKKSNRALCTQFAEQIAV